MNVSGLHFFKVVLQALTAIFHPCFVGMLGCPGLLILHILLKGPVCKHVAKDCQVAGSLQCGKGQAEK